MNEELSNSDSRRGVIGLTFLVLGILLVLWAWGSWVYRAAAPHNMVGSTRKPLDAPQQAQWLGANAMVLVVGFLLFLVVLVGSFAIVRMMRRRQAAINRKRPAPTASDDMWSRHRLPNEDE